MSDATWILALTASELRDELRERGLGADGLKPVLRSRLSDYLAKNADDPGMQLVHKPVVPLKACKTKEPTRDKFDTEEEFQLVWSRWRDARNMNNESVRRSRQKKRLDKRVWETQGDQLQQRNTELQSTLGSLQTQLALLSGLAQGAALTIEQLQLLAPLFANEPMPVIDSGASVAVNMSWPAYPGVLPAPMQMPVQMSVPVPVPSIAGVGVMGMMGMGMMGVGMGMGAAFGGAPAQLSMALAAAPAAPQAGQAQMSARRRSRAAAPAHHDDGGGDDDDEDYDDEDVEDDDEDDEDYVG